MTAILSAMIVQYFLPLIFGPINNSIFADFFGWTGLKSILGNCALFRWGCSVDLGCSSWK